MADRTVIRDIKRHGNGAMISIHKADMEALGVEVGASVRVSIETVDDAYDQTMKAGEEMIGRYTKTLERLGQ
jgi:antitoxin component of MazEF toxin-antitoxin module